MQCWAGATLPVARKGGVSTEPDTRGRMTGWPGRCLEAYGLTTWLGSSTTGFWGMIRTAVKRALEGMVARTGMDRLGRWLRRGRGVVLAYHNVVPNSALRTGDLSLHLRVSDFGRQLDLLCRVGRVAPLEEILSGRNETDRRTMTFAITFDDAYRGAVELGVRELERRGLPATIFVPPGLLGDRTFWWDALYRDAVDAGGSGRPELWRRILTEGNGTLQRARQVAQESGVEIKTMPKLWRSATEEELQEAARVAGITVGSHGWSHASLIRLSGDALVEELARPRDWLGDRFGDRYVDILSYPYGLHSASVRAAARRAGYLAGLALVPGSVHVADIPQSMSDAFSLPRLNVPAGLSLSGLQLRTAWC